MPDPASGMEMDPEFVRLVRAIWEGGFDCGWNSHRTRKADDSGVEAVRALHEELHRWHLDAVERGNRAGQLGYEVALIAALAPLGVRFLDPPDGGNVTPLEQVQRLVAEHLMMEKREGLLSRALERTTNELMEDDDDA